MFWKCSLKDVKVNTGNGRLYIIVGSNEIYLKLVYGYLNERSRSVTRCEINSPDRDVRWMICITVFDQELNSQVNDMSVWGTREMNHYSGQHCSLGNHTVWSTGGP